MAEVWRFPEGGRPRTGLAGPSGEADVVRPDAFKRTPAPAAPMEEVPTKNQLVLTKPAFPMMLLQKPAQESPTMMHVSGFIVVPLPARETVPTVPLDRVWFANMQAAVFDLEKAIARLVKDSDGGSRRIPELRTILRTLEAGLLQHKK